jgi:predicted DNA-binding antitoxin AbrB/MazE fold protein
METVHAIYENGVFRPTVPVDLPEHTPVEFEPRLKAEASENGEQPAKADLSPGLAKVYGVLGERYASGHSDTAERHNEHQP